MEGTQAHRKPKPKNNETMNFKTIATLTTLATLALTAPAIAYPGDWADEIPEPESRRIHREMWGEPSDLERPGTYKTYPPMTNEEYDQAIQENWNRRRENWNERGTWQRNADDLFRGGGNGETEHNWGF